MKRTLILAGGVVALIFLLRLSPDVLSLLLGAVLGAVFLAAVGGCVFLAFLLFGPDAPTTDAPKETRAERDQRWADNIALRDEQR